MQERAGTLQNRNRKIVIGAMQRNLTIAALTEKILS